MKKAIILLTILFFAFTAPTFAHPGRTAGDGCHYCRTNCDSWGEAWGERHCHGGYVPPAYNTRVEPTPTPWPTLEPTPVYRQYKGSEMKNFLDFMIPFVGIGLVGILSGAWLIEKVVKWIKE